MTLTIEFAPQTEAWIAGEAERLGVPPAEVVRKVVAEKSGTTAVFPNANPAVELLDRWLQEDATSDPETIHKADQEYEELKNRLNANRAATGERPIFP